MNSYFLALAKPLSSTSSQSNGTVQRTIEEVNSDGVPLGQVSVESRANSQANRTVFFGLGAVLLIIIAAWGVSMLWKYENSGRAAAKPNIPPEFP